MHYDPVPTTILLLWYTVGFASGILQESNKYVFRLLALLNFALIGSALLGQ